MCQAAKYPCDPVLASPVQVRKGVWQLCTATAFRQARMVQRRPLALPIYMGMEDRVYICQTLRLNPALKGSVLCEQRDDSQLHCDVPWVLTAADDDDACRTGKYHATLQPERTRTCTRMPLRHLGCCCCLWQSQQQGGASTAHPQLPRAATAAKHRQLGRTPWATGGKRC